MEMELHDKVYREEPFYFVGRAKELEVMRRHITEGSRWQWLHMYGPSGIGKSRLFKQFESICIDVPLNYLDGNSDIEQQEATLKLLSKQLEQQNGSSEPNIVLLIDSFDQWRFSEYWFTQWLGHLKPTLRIITAGQNSLTGKWLRSRWATLIHTVQLQTLTSLEVELYAQKRGLSDPGASTQLFRFSRGFPLAMMLATEVMLRGGEYRLIDHNDKSQLTSLLMNELLKGIPTSIHRLLEAASVYWRFNEERIAAIVGADISADAFRQLIKLSFVIYREDGWTLHDAIRAWILEDFIRRKPQAYEQMRRKALEQIRSEEQLFPHLRRNLYLDKFSLHENSVVRAVCFSGHLNDLSLRESLECDLPTVRSLYVRYHLHAEPTLKENPSMEQLINPIWEAAPSSFITILRHNDIIACYGKIPLNQNTLQVFSEESILKPLVREFKPIPNAFLLSFIGIIPNLAENTRAYIMNTMLSHFHTSEWIITITPLTEWFPVFELVGFERASWADTTTPSGTEYRAFILDLREEDFHTKLNRKLSVGSANESFNQKGENEDIQELKNLLKNWSRLTELPNSVNTYLRLFPRRRSVIDSDEITGHDVQQDLLDSIQTICNGDERVALLGILLTHTYIHVTQPHERIAKQLNLSMATYYRHLNKALKHLYLLLINEV